MQIRSNPDKTSTLHSHGLNINRSFDDKYNSFLLFSIKHFLLYLIRSTLERLFLIQSFYYIFGPFSVKTGLNDITLLTFEKHQTSLFFLPPLISMKIL